MVNQNTCPLCQSRMNGQKCSNGRDCHYEGAGETPEARAQRWAQHGEWDRTSGGNAYGYYEE